jgi:hypothetical protein
LVTFSLTSSYTLGAFWLEPPDKDYINLALDRDSVTTNGKFLYIYRSSCGLAKVGTGIESDKGKIYSYITNFERAEKGWVVCIRDKVYFLSSLHKRPLLRVFDGDLQELQAIDNEELAVKLDRAHVIDVTTDGLRIYIITWQVYLIVECLLIVHRTNLYFVTYTKLIGVQL